MSIASETLLQVFTARKQKARNIETAFRRDGSLDIGLRVEDAKLNKDGRLIRLDYVFRKTAPDGALKHNQSYQNASPSIPFLLISKVLQLLKRTCCVWGCTRLRLVSHALS